MEIQMLQRKVKPVVNPGKKSRGRLYEGQHANVQSILHVNKIQPKLKIGQSNDKYEQEADRVAEQVMRMSESKIQQTSQAVTSLDNNRVLKKTIESDPNDACNNVQELNIVSSEFRRINGSRRLSIAPPLIRSSLASSSIQTKLTIGAPDDAFEREADQVADQVMGMPASPLQAPSAIQRRCVDCEGEVRRQPLPDDELEDGGTYAPPSRLSAKAEQPSSGVPEVSPSVESAIRSMRGGGSSLPGDTRDFFQSRLGHDFSRVRIHTDAHAQSLAGQLGARAMTLGQDILFGQGEYQPEAAAGRHLLAHELTHVVQQRGSIQRLMRACICNGIGRTPTAAEKRSMHGDFPQLSDDEWCITDPPTGTYNCHAWGIGNTSRWIDTEIDRVHGDNDGSLEVSDFDNFYRAHGFEPAPDMSPSNAAVAIYGTNASNVKHSARVSNARCDGTVMFESKLGRDYRLIHPVLDMQGPLYGHLLQYYVPG